MRERWARGLALLTGAMVLILSALFGWLQNPGELDAPAMADSTIAPSPVAVSTDVDHAALKRGRAVFDAQACTACHSILGKGNPRIGLDGVGARLDPDLLRDWTVGAEAISKDLPPHVLRMKRAYADLPGEDLDALVVYLASLTAARNPPDVPE